MSDTVTSAANIPQRVLPTVSLSATSDAKRSSTRSTGRRSKTESYANSVRAGQWVDDDEATTPSRRRKRTPANSSTKGHRRGRSTTANEGSGFLPKLARILESGESSVFSGRSGKGSMSDRRQRHQQIDTWSRHLNRPGAGSGIHQRSSPRKYKVGDIHRRLEALPRINPSLQSLLSSLTRASDHSSSSGTTVTQESYDQKSSRVPEESNKANDQRLSDPEAEIIKTEQRPRAFDYIMDPPHSDHESDCQSVRSPSSSSSSSSHYEPSNASSNDDPGSPSSHSTFGSPTASRNDSLSGSIGVAELRQKYDAQYASSGHSGRSGSLGPDRSAKRPPQILYVPEDDAVRCPGDPPPPFHEVVYDAGRRSESCSSQPALVHGDRLLKQQQETMHRQIAAQSQPHVASSRHRRADSAYELHRSLSLSSSAAGSAEARSAWQPFMAMQQDRQDQQPHGPCPSLAPLAQRIPQRPMSGHAGANVERLPAAPDAPDLTHKTMAGYEMVARELADVDSEVKPVYRKFSYLNHRLLLHMQDELQEMEETLRIYDEIIAQMESDGRTQERHPASRRADYRNGSEVHHRRTMLLGNIFKKMEQYRAILKECRADDAVNDAPKEDVAKYKLWMKEKEAVCEQERWFLDAEDDLVVSNARRRGEKCALEERYDDDDGGGGGGDKVAINSQTLLLLSIGPTVLILCAMLVMNIVSSVSGRLLLLTALAGTAGALAVLKQSSLTLLGRSKD